jgi:glycosyltransferase involved in cell wall biosynthesis
MKIELLVRDYGRMIGLARYTHSLVEALQGSGVEIELVVPGYPWPIRAAHRLLSRFGPDLKTFFSTYPVKARFSRHGLKHLTTQQMAALLWLYPNLHPSVVTVHDILLYLVKGNPEQDTSRHGFDRYFDRQAMSGLKRADMLISVSECTKKMLVEYLNCLEERIAIIPEGVNHEVFHPLPVPEAFYARYGLERQAIYLLYVGSDNPRKNLLRLIRAFNEVHKALPGIRLIKVGSSENLEGANRHRQAIVQFGLERWVHWLDAVSEEDLVFFYNIARIFVFPSLYEGFGLPPLEAMACGTPVVCSNAASLPEVVGDAGLLFDPYDVESMASTIVQVLSNPDMAAGLRRRGLKRAAQFTWERVARETAAVYERVLSKELG